MGEPGTITVRMTCGVCNHEVPVVVPEDATVGTAAEAMLRVHDPSLCLDNEETTT